MRRKVNKFLLIRKISLALGLGVKV